MALENQLVAIDDFLIDCSLSETHTFDSDVTEYPVESGSNVTDNIRPLPLVVEMECLVSNTPIGVIVPYRNLVRGEGSTQFLSKPVDDAYELLTLIRDQRKPVTIRTSLRSYENMALKTLSIPRGAHLDELRFNATFQQIQTVENKRSIRVSIPNGRGKKKVSKAPEPLDMRQIIIDKRTGQWWDPDIGGWRKSAYFTSADIEDDGSSNFINTVRRNSTWHLIRGKIETASVSVSSLGIKKDDPFDTIRQTQPHPIKQQLIVPLYKCTLHGFTIKNATPNANQGNLVIRNRTQ